MRVSRRVLLACAGSALLTSSFRWRAFADAPPAAAFDPSATFSPAALKADLRWLAETMVDVGARPFAYTDKTVWLARRDALIASLTEPLTIWQYWLRAAGPLFSSLNDGHADVTPFATYRTARLHGALALPLILRWDALGLFVDDRTLASMPSGTQILAIDGVAASDLAKGVATVRGAQSEALRLFFAADVVPRYLYAQNPARTQFEVAVRLPGAGVVTTQRVDAMNHDDLGRAYKAFGVPPEPDYTFSRLKDGRVGYIDYRSCDNMDAFKRFLAETFASIKDKAIRGLVIDIRSNTGGDSSLNDQLWQMVTTKPFSQYGASEERISELLKTLYGRSKFVEIYGDGGWSKPGGTLLSFDAEALVRPQANPLRYEGPVYLLIGTGTFSSAMQCAVAASDFGLATIVGGETGEPVNSTGEIFFGQSQGTGITYSFTTKFFTGPKSRPNGQGVLPDVAIPTTAADVQTGRDPVLAYALKAILGA
jgi:hypothetical protein